VYRTGATGSIATKLSLHCEKGLARLGETLHRLFIICRRLPQRVRAGLPAVASSTSRGERGDNCRGAAVALVAQDTSALHFGTQGRADWRALTGAALIGSVVGLGLGAGYLTAGLGDAALHRAETARVALGPNAGFQPAAFEAGALSPQLRGTQGLPAGMDPDAARMAAVAPSRSRELDCLAQAVYFEARGESPRGQQAVATVIMNRVKNPNFPKTVCAVVYQGSTHRNGCQFSFACDGLAERVVERTAWDRARSVAARVLSGAVLRDIGSATHFHTTAVTPDWGSRMLRVAQVGLHVFYRFNPHAKAPVEIEPQEDTAVFASAPAKPAELHLAEALTAPQPVEAKAVAPAAKAVAPAAEAKPPLPKLLDIPPAGLAKAVDAVAPVAVSKTDAPVASNPPAATPS
jgi:spore germination cell wall hydrolase CwlJ-like protein